MIGGRGEGIGKGSATRGKGDSTTESGRGKFFNSRPSKNGIKGKRFLDAGSAYINKNYPKQLSKLINSMEKKARKNI